MVPRSESLDDFFHKLLEPFTHEEIRHFRSKNINLPNISRISELSNEDLNKRVTRHISIDKAPKRPNLKLQRFRKHKESRHGCISSTSEDDNCNMRLAWQLLNRRRRAKRDKEKKYQELLTHKHSDSTSKKINLKKQCLKTKRHVKNYSIWKERVSPDGQIYYHNTTTNHRTWEKPEELKTPSEKLFKTWQEYNFIDGTKFFYNTQTNESTWQIPGDVKNIGQPFIKRVNKSVKDVPVQLKKLVPKENIKPLSEFKRKLIEYKSKNDEIEKMLPNTIKKSSPRNMLVKTALVCVREALNALKEPNISGGECEFISELSSMDDGDTLSTILNYK